MMGLVVVAWTAWAGAAAAQTETPAADGCDPEIGRLVQEAAAPEGQEDADGLVVLDRSTVRVEETGQAHTVRVRVQQALTEAGATRLSVARFDYDPATSLLEVRRVVVHHADGTCTPVALEGMLDSPQPAWSIYWGLRMKLLAVPRPAVGDAVETETYFTGFQIAYLDEPQDSERYVPPMRGHFYDTVLFGDESWPVLEKSYAVDTPLDKPLQFETYGPPVSVSVTADEQANHYVFRAEDLPPLAEGPVSPYFSDWLPKVVMATVPGWREKSRWFFQANESQFAADDAVRETAREITAGLRTDEERVVALNSWVAMNVRYRGLSVGREEGYTMHAGTMTLQHLAGVCKDKAGMLVTLMRALGLEAYPAMTMAGSRVERIAADQFNHAVVAWRQADGSFRMVDPTWAPFSLDLWSRAEASQNFLIGTAEGEDLAITPAEGSARNGLTVRADSRLDADGNLESTVRIEPLGFLEDRVRRMLGRASVLETGHMVEEIASRLSPAASLTDYEFVDPFELGPRFVLRFRYRAEHHAAVGPDTIRFAPPLGRHPLGPGRLADWLQAAAEDEREVPVLLRSAQTVDVEERIALPAGFELVEPVVERADNGVGTFAGTVEQDGSTLVVRWRVVTKHRNVSVEEYAKLREVVAAYEAFAGSEVLLRRAARGEGGAR
jgi:transglutaminase-like putative cysteine protease